METSRFSVETELQHKGICDASGAIALDEEHFVVANDEDNILRVYRSDTSGTPVSEIAGTDINKGSCRDSCKKVQVESEILSE